MKKGVRAAAAAMALAGMLAGNPVSAKCWSAEEVAAATLRDMDSMLMVSALRCRLAGRNFVADYNRFVRQARPALSAANEVLRARMGIEGYDRYQTLLANRYGGGADGMNCKQVAEVLSDAREEHGSATGLAKVAREVDASLSLPGGRCAPRVADRR